MSIENILYVVATLLAIVGSLNWGAYAFNHNLVKKIENKTIQKSIYYLIAISGIVLLVFFIRYKGSIQRPSLGPGGEQRPTPRPLGPGGTQRPTPRPLGPGGIQPTPGGTQRTMTPTPTQGLIGPGGTQRTMTQVTRA